MIGSEDASAMAYGTRIGRAKTIAATSGAIKKVKPGLYTVHSQSGVGLYRVENNGGWKCNCPDFITNGRDCKHILAVHLFNEALKGNIEEDCPEIIRPTYSQDWSAYNTAQMDEIRLFDCLLKDLVQTVCEPEQVMGRPRIPMREQLFCAIQKVYSQLSSRRAYGLYMNATERGQIDHTPHFNTPSKVFNRPEITPILHELIALSALPLSEMEVDFAIDSTGFRTTMFNVYNGMKHGGTQEHKWLKAHICTGVRTNIITSAVITDANGSDPKQFSELVEKTSEGFVIREVSADLAYTSRENHEIVRDHGGVAYIPFRSNATGRADGSLLWKKMYHYFQFNKEEYLEHYHKRSNIEATNAAIKKKFGETLKSKNPIAQRNELLAKFIAYNITVIIREMYENEIVPDFIGRKENYPVDLTA